MPWPQLPTDRELGVFFRKLRAWRRELSDREQQLVDSMAAAALGQAEEPYRDEPPLFRDPSIGCAADSDAAPCEEAGWSTRRWLATPWGMAYSARDC